MELTIFELQNIVAARRGRRRERRHVAAVRAMRTLNRLIGVQREAVRRSAGAAYLLHLARVRTSKGARPSLCPTLGAAERARRARGTRALDVAIMMADSEVRTARGRLERLRATRGDMVILANATASVLYGG